MSWSYAIYDTITGVRQAGVEPVSNSMGRLLNTGSSGSTVVLPQEGVSRAQFRALTTPWARTLVKFWNGKPLFAHIITGRKWDVTAGRLTLDHSDVWALLGRRTTFGSNGYSGWLPENNRLEMINHSLASMPSWLLWAGTEGPTPNFDLPIYLPEGKITNALVHALPFAGSDSRTYWDYEVQFVEPAIKEIVAVGPDVDFEPRIVDGFLQLHLRVGDLAGGFSDWNMASASPELFNVSETEDASKQANVVHAIGKGSEADMRVRTAQSSPSVPALERAVNYKDIDDLAVLQKHADADLATFNQPTRQWSASLFASSGKGIDSMPLGHVLRLYFKDHAWEPDGWQNLRMVGFSTTENETVSLTIQPTGGD